jgi:CRP/FNR family transcriptional regulator, cyclic AMP receptor protein
MLSAAEGRTALQVSVRKAIFSQGGSGDAVYYIQKGRVRIAVVSQSGKEATLALLGPGDFIGEDCIGRGQKRIASAIAMSNCTLIKISRAEMLDCIATDVLFPLRAGHRQRSSRC